MALFSFWLLNLFLGTGWFPRSLVGLPLSYLAPKFPRNLHSWEECPGPWIIQVFNLPTGKYTCRIMRFPELSPIAEWFCDEAFSPLLCLLWPAWLAFYLVGFFIGRFYNTFINRFRNLHLLKHVNWFFNEIYSQSKPFAHACLLHILSIIFNKISFYSVNPIFSDNVAPGKKPSTCSRQSNNPCGVLLLDHAVS